MSITTESDDLNRPWLRNYPNGVAATINPDQYASLVALAEESFARFGENLAFTNMGHHLTYQEIDQLSQKFACYLQKQIGIKKRLGCPSLRPTSPCVTTTAIRYRWAKPASGGVPKRTAKNQRRENPAARA